MSDLWGALQPSLYELISIEHTMFIQGWLNNCKDAHVAQDWETSFHVSWIATTKIFNFFLNSIRFIIILIFADHTADSSVAYNVHRGDESVENVTQSDHSPRAKVFQMIDIKS